MMESEDIKRLRDFLEKAHKMKAMAMIKCSGSLFTQVEQMAERVFSGKKVRIIDNSQTETLNHDEIDKTVSASLKEGGLLIVALTGEIPAHLLRRLEQTVKDGHIPILVGKSWRKTEVVEGWQGLVILPVERDGPDVETLESFLEHKFTIK